MNLQAKIKNGDTELQRAFHILIQKERDIEGQINWHEIELEWQEKQLIKVREEMEYCKQRAAEQGYPNLFED